jgi:small subunit ribosomal protein S1
LHITDISWDKITHPSEKIFLGQKLKVIVTKYSCKDRRVSLGLKQLNINPWKGLEKKYLTGSIHCGKVISISDYGVFVELSSFVEGLVYLNEINWNIKNIHPTRLININDNVNVKILDIDINKHRISLSMKQCYPNPWSRFITKYPVGTSIKVVIKKIVPFGLFVNILNDYKNSNLDLLVPAFEIDSNDNPIHSLKTFKVGDEIFCIVISTNLSKERITLSIKQCKERQYKLLMYKLISSKFVTCKVLKIINQEGIYVELLGGIKGIIKKTDISQHLQYQNLNNFIVGDKINARVISFDKTRKLLYLSIKILEIKEEKKAMKQYGTHNSFFCLGDILSDVIKNTKLKM